jgi:putative tryptophan/tyrosine transport system substrate-binding protein
VTETYFGFLMVRLGSPQVLDFGFSERKRVKETAWLRVLNFCFDNLKSKIQNLKWAGIGAIGLTFAICGVVAEAQPSKKVYRIAILSPSTRPRPVIEALRQELRDLGYTEGQNVIFEDRYADFKTERLPQLAFELVKLKPDIIFTHSVTGAKAAKEATTTIPVVIGAAGDLVQDGLVASLARPGGNITGVTLLSSELEGKRLELLKEASRKVARVAVLVNSANPAWERYPQILDPAARALGLKLQRVEVRNPADFDRAFASILQNDANGILVVTDAIFTDQTRIAEFAVKHRLSSISELPRFAETGGLIQYGLSIPDMGRHAAALVDKILKGAKPADLPVERPTKFEFIINLKTAKQIGLTIPPEMLARADKVIR